MTELQHTPATLAWGARVSPLFRSRLWDLCYRLGWTVPQANWLMACMAFETGETFSPSIQNAAGSGAVGLIQFMPLTAQYLGHDIKEIQAMTAVEQLAVVQKYFRPYASRIASLNDMYMAILLPRYIGKPDTSVLFTSGSVAYRQNGALDADNNGRITKAEACTKVRSALIRGMRPENIWIETEQR